MRAAVYYGKEQPLVIEEVSKPDIGPLDLLLKVSRCGICGSDVHFAQEQGVAPGTVFGHEFSGVIEQLGSSAVGDFKVGDSVIALGGIPCGECPACLNQAFAQCQSIGLIGCDVNFAGAYSEYVRVSSLASLKVPESVDMSDAAVVEPLAVGLNAWRKVAPQAGADVLILGAGPIGLAMVKWARFFGAANVVLSEMVPSRMERARQAGADLVLDAKQEKNPVEAMVRETGRSPTVIFECVGRPMLQHLFDIAPHQSHLCLLGACMKSESINISTATLKDLSLTIPLGYGVEEFAFILDLLAREKMDTQPLISDEISLNQVPEIFEALKQPNDHCKVIIDLT
ncbi:MAG TPA: alcohol dehydrogenase [Porticoccus sp.]|nr:alcohol dehydrogenase [Porticoccus sp.]